MVIFAIKAFNKSLDFILENQLLQRRKAYAADNIGWFQLTIHIFIIVWNVTKKGNGIYYILLVKVLKVTFPWKRKLSSVFCPMPIRNTEQINRMDRPNQLVIWMVFGSSVFGCVFRFRLLLSKVKLIIMDEWIDNHFLTSQRKILSIEMIKRPSTYE